MGRTGWSVAAERWDPILRALVGAPRCPQRQALLLEMSEDVCRSCANPTCARAWARVMLVCVCCVCMHVPVCACACARACESCRQLSACVCGCVCARAWRCVHGVGTCARVCMRMLLHTWACVRMCEHVAVARLGHQHWAAWCGTSVPSSGPVVDGVRSWRPGCHPRLGPCRPWRRAYPGLTCAPSSLPCVQCGSSLPLRSSSVVFASGKLLDLFAMLGQVS